jgi:delta-1-pyrroline-5-carboxylate synthetase
MSSYNSACAAAGQLGLMSLYETMFNQFDVTVSQLLLTSFDFTSAERRSNIQRVITQLLKLGVVPLLNENDAVSANQGYETFGTAFSDNDSLASLVAVETSAQLLVLLTDVQGVYDRPPTDPLARIISVYKEEEGFTAGSKSLQGRGGMTAKVAAALQAVKGGVQATVIASGRETDVLGRVVQGEELGTLFLPPNISDSNSGTTITTTESSCVSPVESEDRGMEALRATAMSAREAGRKLAALSAHCRDQLLAAMADKLEARVDDLLEANGKDINAAEAR